jgi:dCMP deaminase
MDVARLVSERSKDRSTKIGSVLVGPDREIRSTGYNGFPRGVNDDVDARHERPAKYMVTEHAERNCLYNAARAGICTNGCVMYVSGMLPCSDCARAIIQCGITDVYVESMECTNKGMDWNEHARVAQEMLMEAGVKLHLVK